MNGILGSKIPDTHFTLYLFLTLQNISLLFIIGIIFWLYLLTCRWNNLLKSREAVLIPIFHCYSPRTTSNTSAQTLILLDAVTKNLVS